MILHVCILSSKMVKSGFKTKGTLLELALLLVAHGHIVKELKGYELVSLAPTQVDSIEDPMGFLKQEKSIFELVAV